MPSCYLIFSFVLCLLALFLHVLSPLLAVHPLLVDLELLDVRLVLLDLDHLLALLRLLLKLGQLERLSRVLRLFKLLQI